MVFFLTLSIFLDRPKVEKAWNLLQKRIQQPR